MRNGETEESRLFSHIGKCLCVWLIWKHAEPLIQHWEVLLVLLAFLIVPEVAKKAITLRFGGNSTNGVINGNQDKEEKIYEKTTHTSTTNKDLVPDLSRQ